MNSGYPNPSQILPLFFKINRQARIRWTITQDLATPNTTGWTWQLFVKRFAGARQNVINLTLGNGLRYEVYSDTILIADFSSLQTDLEEGEYYYELVRTDIETTWQEGTARFEFAKTSTSVIEESNFTINVDSNGSPITLAVASSQTININGITQAQLDTKQDKPTVVTGNTTAEIDAVYYVTASATFTDPTPVQGKGFTVFVRNGTATVGGTGYSTAGTIVKRVYHSGAWANYEIGGGGGGTWGSITGTLSNQTDLQAALNAKPIAGINAKTDDYTLVLADRDYVVDMNKATALSLTVPPNSSVAFPVGTIIYIRRTGAGTLTIAQGSGVTVTGSAGVLTDPGLNVMMTLRKTGTDTWDLQNGVSPIWSDWSPTLTGFSSNPSLGSARYMLIGKICTVYYTPSGLGTSNATTKTITLPFTAANTAIQAFFIISQDNGGAQVVGRLQTRVGSNIADVYATAAAGGWTASGSARFYLGGISYEIA